MILRDCGVEDNPLRLSSMPFACSTFFAYFVTIFMSFHAFLLVSNGFLFSFDQGKFKVSNGFVATVCVHVYLLCVS